MIKQSTKKWLIALTNLVVVGIGIIYACAGGWWTFEESTNFTPELTVDSVYKPFFYSYDYYYTGYDMEQNTRFNKTVVNDWYNYLDKKFKKDDIDALLFKTYNGTLDSMQKPGLPIPIRLSSITWTKTKDKKVNDFLSYLALAKQCEAFAVRGDNEWNYYDDKPAKVRSASAAFCASILNTYKNCKDNFIKPRLFFQMIRAYYYNKDYNTCINLFEGNATLFQKNVMYYRTLSYAAGAYRKAGKLSQANYYYSLVYNNCHELKTTAHFSFKPQDEKDWQQTLALCTNADEKCTLWQMLGVFYQDEIRSMNEIIKIDPKSDKLDLLLARAINRLEGNAFEVNSYAEIKSPDPANENTKKYSDFKNTINGLLAEKKLNKPYQWYMAVGYMNVFDKEHAKAAENFKLASKNAGGNTKIVSEARILDLINTLYEIKTIDKGIEEKLLKEFTWLEELKATEYGKQIRTMAVSSWIKKVMSVKYRNQKDFLKAEFYELSQSFYTSNQQLHDMQNFLQKSGKTSYEEYCAKIYGLSLEDLYEFEAIDKVLNDDIDGAVVLMEKAGKNGEKTLLSNPFNGGIKDCHDCDHAVAQKTKYSKLATLKKMKEMKDKLTSDTYNNALLIANAYYNMTYHGSSRVFYTCAVSDIYYGTQGVANSKSYLNKLTDMTLAKKYYRMALTAVKNDEQKAKVYYMLSKCERNDWYNAGNPVYDKGIDFLYWSNFAELKKLSATKYYKDVINECGYFKACMRK